MYIRRKRNQSGSTSIQVVDKSSGQYRVVRTIGSSQNEEELQQYEQQARRSIELLQNQEVINFDEAAEYDYINQMLASIDSLHLAGPELIIGKIFNEIGFDQIKEDLFRHLVIARLCYPASKLKTVDYLYRYKGIHINIDRIYRYLDKLNNKQKELVQQISYTHTLKISGNKIRVVFYDVTTLYFETDNQDEFRLTGFSKEGRHSNPQIILGLLISMNGDPLAYEIYEGNKYEGVTMLPIIQEFTRRFNLEKLVIVADSGLLSEKNLAQLQAHGYDYIIGARIKNESHSIKAAVLGLSLSNGESTEIQKGKDCRLIISYSDKRAKKDILNRTKGIKKLESKIKSGKLTKSNINNKGYNKFLKMEGNVSLSLDLEKINQDSCWDGLKGYLTNTSLSIDEVIEQYGNLWKIEKAFRIAKTDLRIRPIYHRLKSRIQAHICIAFCAYKVYKELERQLKESNCDLSVEKAIEIMNTIFRITFVTPKSKTQIEKLIIKNKEQKMLLYMFGYS